MRNSELAREEGKCGTGMRNVECGIGERDGELWQMNHAKALAG
jgi:hypothetical protein